MSAMGHQRPVATPAAVALCPLRPQKRTFRSHSLSNSGSLAMLTAIRRASSKVNCLASTASLLSVYEQSMNTGFGQSCRGYVLLRYLGYPMIKILHGGYAAWTAAGLPTVTGVTTPMPRTFPLDPAAAGILVDLQGMKAAVANPNLVKLDTRDVDEWIAESSSPYGKDFCPRKGRIPGAVWIEWYRMMKPT